MRLHLPLILLNGWSCGPALRVFLTRTDGVARSGSDALGVGEPDRSAHARPPGTPVCDRTRTRGPPRG